MRSEAQYCTSIVKSLNSVGDLAYKIPDASGNFATSIRVFDIMGRKDNKPLYLEAKFNKDPSAFNFRRIEDHQAYYLDEDLLTDKITKERKGDKYIVTIPFEEEG